MLMMSCWCSAKAYPLQALMEDSRQFFRATGRRVTFEYTLMAGVNDSVAQVSRTRKLLCNSPPLKWNSLATACM